MKFTLKEAKAIGDKFNINWRTIPLKEWRYALHVELEHGSMFGKKANVTKDDIRKTAMIALAHYMEFPDYYKRLSKMEERAEKYWKNKKKPNIFKTNIKSKS
jgi:hypothetical protein